MRLLKETIRRFLWSRGKDIITRPSVISRQPAAQLKPSLTAVLSEMLLEREHLTIVQVGAFDGVSDDPLHDFIVARPVRAVLVEPQPPHFARLRQTYARCPNVRLVNAAIDERDGERDMYCIRRDAQVPSWLHMLASFDKAVMLSHAHCYQQLESVIDTIKVPCLSPGTLLKTVDVTRVDALVVDTEGFDARIIRAFRTQGVEPDVIFFEHVHLAWDDYSAIASELIDSGYQVAALEVDVLAYRHRNSASTAVVEGTAAKMVTVPA